MAARNLTFSNYEIRSNVLLDELGWERLEISRSKQLTVCMYNVHNNLSLSYLRYLKRIVTNTALLTMHSKNVHAYNFGNSKINFHIPRRHLEQSLEKITCSIKDLFCGIEFPKF